MRRQLQTLGRSRTAGSALTGVWVIDSWLSPSTATVS